MPTEGFRVFRPCAAALLMLFTSIALADQAILLDSNLPSDFVPVTATAPTSTGFWALGASDGQTTLVRYDVNGAPQILRYPDMQYVLYGEDFNIVANPGGGVLTTDVEPIYLLGNYTCRLRRFDAGGNYLWAYDLGQTISYGSYVGNYCSAVYVDGSGQIWLFLPRAVNGYLYTFSQDGTSGPQFSFPDTLGDHAAADPTDNVIYLPGATGMDPGSGLATIWKFTSQGQQWAASAPATDQGSILKDAALAADGSVWAFGNKGAQLFGMHVAANGTLLWSGSFTTTVNPTEVRVVARADGGVSTLHWDTMTVVPEVSTFSSTGSRLWHVASGLALSSDQSLIDLHLAAGSDGDVVAAVLYHESFTTYARQTRFNSNGTVLFSGQPQAQPEAPLSNSFSLAMYSDDTSLITAGSFEHLARKGATLVAPTTSAITLATTLDANARLGPDGSAYTVVTNASSKLVGVSAYSNTGALRWHSSIPSSWSNDGLQGISPLLLRTSDVCVTGDLDGNEIVQCFALTDGTTTVMKVLGPVLPQPVPFTQAKVTANDLIVLLYSAADGSLHHVLIDASGNLLHNITPLQVGETWGGSGLNAAGDAAIVTSSSTLLKLAADGSRVYSVATDASFSSVALSDDGTAILSQSGPPLLVERVDPTGNRLWQSAMPAGPYFRVTSIRFTDSALYCTVLFSNFTFANGDIHPQESGLVSKIALSDGSIQWTTPFTYLFGSDPLLVLGSDDQDLLLFSSWNDRIQVRDYATADGSELGGKFEPCNIDQCAIYNAILASDGTLRMVNDTTDYVSGSQFQMIIMQKEFDKIFADGFGN
jgi:hypothetical protein